MRKRAVKNGDITFSVPFVQTLAHAYIPGTPREFGSISAAQLIRCFDPSRYTIRERQQFVADVIQYVVYCGYADLDITEFSRLKDILYV